MDYATLEQRSNRLAHALRGARSFEAGERVALLARNRMEVVEVLVGVSKAAMVYVGLNFRMTPAELENNLATHNPIDRLAPLAAAKIPLFAIHGDADTLVPLAANSALVKSRYTALGGEMELIIAPGQGHTHWEGFFRCRELVDFGVRHARR